MRSLASNKISRYLDFAFVSSSRNKAGNTLNIHVLGYLKDSNAAAHSVDSDIFYAVIQQPARSKTYAIKPLFLKVVSNRGESVVVCITFMHHDGNRSFRQRVSSPTTSSPTYEVDSPTSDVSSPTLISQFANA